MVLFGWWRRNVRTLRKPKNAALAEKWYQRLSVLYAFLAWNAVGVGLYGMSRKKQNNFSLENKAELFPDEQTTQKKRLINARIIHLNKDFKHEKKDPAAAGV
ncbi:uncharacterized protein [Euwallacea fornicatus]|uniref:uncharacterized protein n=1 Tax=Euwallacea fornicatus TaxID=995702 RepID=UPI00338F86FE